MSVKDYTIDAICSARWICDILLLLALLCLLLLIDLPLLCVGFLLLNGGEDVVGFQVFWIIWMDSAIFHLLEFLYDVSKG